MSTADSATGGLPPNVQPVGAQLVVTTHQEPGITISQRRWRRIKARVQKTKEGIEVLWLSGATAFAGVAASIGITLLEIIDTPDSKKYGVSHLTESARDVLTVVFWCSCLLTVVGLCGYFAIRRRRHDEIDEIIKDMEADEPPDMND